MTKRNIENEIIKLKSQIDKLEKERLVIEKMSVEQRIADYLHENLCHWNHVDGCGWEYESWEKPGETRNHWAHKARLVYSAIETYVGDIMYDNGVEAEDVPEKLKKQEKLIEDVIYQIIRSIK